MLEWTTSGILFLALLFTPAKEVNIPVQYQLQPESSILCDLTVDAGPDTNVCDPGGLVGLMGSISGSSIFYQWSPATGLNNPFILNPVANITDPITYTLTAYGIDPSNPNLVTNGDFELGNIGFTSDYTYVADIPGLQNEMQPAGTYSVVSNPNLVHAGFSGCNDHTGGGNMMVVNGAPSFQNIWCQTIMVSTNTWYNVSAWAASVHSASPAILRFSINGNPIGPVITAPNITCQWVPFNANWNSGNSTTATICILNLNTDSGGNDFAIDDISMVGLCLMEDEIDITLYEEVAPEPEISGPAFLCAGDIGVYLAEFPPDPVIFSYEWILPPDAVIISGQGTTQVTVLWEEAQEESICIRIETRCEMNEGCFDVIVEDLPDLPLIAGASSLCEGEIVTLYTPEVDPDDTYQWTIPSEVVLLSGGGTNEIEIQWANAGEAEICLEVTNACGSTDNCTFLTTLPSSLTLFDTTLCVGTTILINGNVYGNGNWSGIEQFISVNGCDSLVQIEISEASTLTFSFTETLCPGDSIFLEGEFQSLPGIYVDSFITVTNCDSLVITEVFISAFDTTWMTSITCDPTEADTTITTYSIGTCDSTVILQIVLVPMDTTVISTYSCSPLDTGQTLQVLANQNGCDSLIIRITSLSPTDTTLFFQNTCDPSQAGISSQSFVNVSGCDSTVINTISFLASDTTIIFSVTCMYSDTGSSSTLLVNSIGCDSLVIEYLSYAGSDTTFVNSETCSPSDSGLITLNLVNQFGCDSVIVTYTSLNFADTTYFNFTSCEPLDTGVVIQNLINNAGCDSLVITTTLLDAINLCVIDATYLVRQPLCYGDTALVFVNILAGLGPFELVWTHQDIVGFFDYPTTGIYSFPFEIEGESYIQLTSANGLTILDTIYVDLIAPLEIQAQAGVDFSGFGVPCNGDSLGIAQVEVLSGGTPPLTFSWSTGADLQELTNLKSGIYEITVTDKNGCETSDSIVITEPPRMLYNFSFEDISCFGEMNGAAILSNTQGGVTPWLTSLDGSAFQPFDSYQNLAAGMHALVIKDQNGCTLEESFILAEPQDWNLQLGSDTSIAYGTNFTLSTSIVGQPQGELDITWSDGMCVNCLSRDLQITSGSTIEVSAIDKNGCSSADKIVINVFIDHNYFIPNIFSPNGDMFNDRFMVSSNTALEEIEELIIYDRWGNIVFQSSHFPPNDEAYAWDGYRDDQPLNPGVFVYRVTVKFKDGRTEMKFGDVTLVR